MNQLTPLHPDVVQSMTELKPHYAPLRLIIRDGGDGREQQHTSIAVQSVSNDKIQPWSGEVMAPAKDEANIKHDRGFTETRTRKLKTSLHERVKCAVEELVANEMESMVKQALDEVLKRHPIRGKVAPALSYITLLSSL